MMRRFALPRLPALAASTLLALALTATAAQGHGTPAPEHGHGARAVHDLHFGSRVAVPPGGTARATVHCPHGETPTGGGGAGSDGVHLVASTTHGGDDWTVRGFNGSDDAPGTLTPFVACAEHGARFGGNGPQTTLAPGVNGSVSNACPSGEVVTGGGWDTSDDRVFVTQGIATGDQWTVRGANRTGDGQGPSVTLMCSDRPHSQHTGRQVLVKPGQTASATAVCPPDEVPTGGGGSARDDTFLSGSAATADDRGWETRATNTGTEPQTLYAQVICAAP
ncbi:hypothetical protein [Streptomyces luteireticuli]|uniref:hypothetical protein n=1 Tax=Streptomyces luteireticuli TaxID=173858 RepID=UPI00355712DD